MRVWAEKGTKTAPAAASGAWPNWRAASAAMLRPSGVSSACEARQAARARTSAATPGAGWKALA